eukprot:g6092.t1
MSAAAIIAQRRKKKKFLKRIGTMNMNQLLKANDLAKHPELLSLKTKVTPKVHNKQSYKFVREGLINENMVQRSNTKSSVTSKDPLDKLQELRRTHGAGSQEYKDFLQQTLDQKKQQQQEKDIVAEKE